MDACVPVWMKHAHMPDFHTQEGKKKEKLKIKVMKFDHLHI